MTNIKNVKTFGSRSELEQVALGDILRKITEGHSTYPVTEWSQQNYQTLTDRLYEVSKIQLNPKTLKLLFGKWQHGEDLNPHKQTREAFAKLLGYTSWQAYLDEGYSLQQKTITEPDPIKPKVWPFILRYQYLFICTIIALTGLVIWYVIRLQHQPSAQIEIGEPEGFAPRSVLIKYNMDKLITDSTYLVSGYGGRKFWINNPGKGEFLVSYYKPGIFHPKILQVQPDGKTKVLNHTKVFSYHNSWMETTAIPEEITEASRSQKGYLGHDSSILQTVTPSVRTKQVFQIYRTYPYPISLDTILVYARFRNSERSNILHSRE